MTKRAETIHKNKYDESEWIIMQNATIHAQRVLARIQKKTSS